MTHTQSRRAMTVGFSVVTLILLLASTAMACTVFKGTMTVTPLAAGSGVSTATGKGTSMSFCASSMGATIPITGDKVKVEVKQATGCSTDQLSAGKYTVNYASNGGSDCMTVVLGGVGSPVGTGAPVSLGTFTVDGTGAGSTEVTIPGISSGVFNTIGLCVTSTTVPGLTTPEGNQVSLTII